MDVLMMVAVWMYTATWTQVFLAGAIVVSGGSIIAFAVAMVADGIRNGW